MSLQSFVYDLGSESKGFRRELIASTLRVYKKLYGKVPVALHALINSSDLSEIQALSVALTEQIVKFYGSTTLGNAVGVIGLNLNLNININKTAVKSQKNRKNKDSIGSNLGTKGVPYKKAQKKDKDFKAFLETKKPASIVNQPEVVASGSQSLNISETVQTVSSPSQTPLPVVPSAPPKDLMERPSRSNIGHLRPVFLRRENLVFAGLGSIRYGTEEFKKTFFPSRFFEARISKEHEGKRYLDTDGHFVNAPQPRPGVSLRDVPDIDLYMSVDFSGTVDKRVFDLLKNTRHLSVPEDHKNCHFCSRSFRAVELFTKNHHGSNVLICRECDSKGCILM